MTSAQNTTPQFNTASLARITSGRLLGADVPFMSVSTDSRTIDKDALFVALHGPNFDGHDYVRVAMERGAAAALVSRELDVPLPQVRVNDVLAALSQFSHAWRMQFAIPVIGITGSNGKTTTKEMIGSIMNQQGEALITRGNLNNHIGVPLTLLRLSAMHRSAVVEMGANHRGEIAALSSLSSPTVGIVTNAGRAHLEGFGGIDGVAQGKGELFVALSPQGTAVINADDVYASYWRSHCAAKTVLTFGIDNAADFRASDMVMDEHSSRFVLHAPTGDIAVNLNLVGKHNIRNATGAAAAAFAAGATLQDIRNGLNAMRAVSGRLQPGAAIKGAQLIDDSYNANPNSLMAGVDALCALQGRHWLVMGDMLEMGDESVKLHAEMGAYARMAGVEHLFAVGTFTPHAVNTFGNGAQWFASVDELISAVQSRIAPEVVVLIKGSRGNRLERVAAALSASAGSHQHTGH
ncbi:MAG TPA: UDP-N-acetylmuramoyl-tripeptide--D-alanyl-D-alanine ligase [Steroidobacteraceae bacterium]|nr:UDP-N-acetylmuramoyl-tripeptide--D-alanyl-D-alanine ligase [Steroidobacteraceae bacterium]